MSGQHRTLGGGRTAFARSRTKIMATLLPLSLAVPASGAFAQTEVQPEPEAQAQTRMQPQTQPPVQSQQTAPATMQSQTQAQAAQGPWRGLTIPTFAGATNVRVEADDDEYELYFSSNAGVQAVFDFYRRYLEGQGFRVTATSASQQGAAANRTGAQAQTATEQKRGADMVRGQGGPDNEVELDVKRRGDGTYKVEIEFDD